MPQSESTRERLLDAAVEAIDSGGEVAVRIREIAAKADVTVPSVYHFFGSREGLIEAALAKCYIRDYLSITAQFAGAVYKCKNKADFVVVAHRVMDTIFASQRAKVRSTRITVLGSAQHRPTLAKAIALAQDIGFNATGEPIRYAQAKGWIREDFDPEMFAAWLAGIMNGRLLVELDGTHPQAKEWDVIAKRAVCLVLGIPEPTKKRATRAT